MCHTLGAASSLVRIEVVPTLYAVFVLDLGWIRWKGVAEVTDTSTSSVTGITLRVGT